MSYIKVVSSVVELIGNTPMIKLSKFNPKLSFNLYAKCEMFNPSLSIKDRIAISIIKDLEKNKTLKPGGTIIEASSGNTGSSLAMVAVVLGYKAVITVPEKTSLEKIRTMRAFGAEVIICPGGVSPDSTEHYTNKAKQLTSIIPDSILLGQYENQMNVQTHYEQTAQEIWVQMDGKIDYLIAVASSGGTITGISKYLKAKNSHVKVIMPDPVGSIFYNHYHHNDKQLTSKPYRVEGAGKDKICPLHDFYYIDDVQQFTDEDAFNAAKKLAVTEGILAGGSSGGALFVAEKLNEGFVSKQTETNVVVILPDSGFKYLSNM
jgi:cysteine synthase